MCNYTFSHGLNKKFIFGTIVYRLKSGFVIVVTRYETNSGVSGDRVLRTEVHFEYHRKKNAYRVISTGNIPAVDIFHASIHFF